MRRSHPPVVVALALAAAVVAVVAVVAGCTDGGADVAELTERPEAPPLEEPEAGLVGRPFDTDAGATLTVADLLESGPVVVNFWASWCAPCIQEMPEFEEVHLAYAGRVTFVGINVNDRPEDAADMIERTGITYLVGMDPDGSYAEAAGALSMPTTLVFATDGSIVETTLGAMSGEELRAVLDEVLGP